MEAIPTVSVVVPAYDATRFVTDALDSIARQRHAPFEVIVVDDGSGDDTPEIAAAHPVGATVLRRPHRGPSAARNAGIEHATGDLLAFLDADDLWPADKLALQVARLQQRPTLAAVLGRVRYVACEGAVMPALPFEDTDTKTLVNVHLGSAVFRRDAFARVGGFDESLRFSEDHDWFLRAREQDLEIEVMRETTLVYRLHAGNMTRGRTVRELAMTDVLKRSLDRRRASGGLRELPTWRTDGDEVGP